MKNSKLNVKVAKKQLLSSNIAAFELVDMEDKSLPDFTAGSHIDVHISDNCIRQYSLCNNPNEIHRYCIAIKHTDDSRGGSRAMYNDIKEGQQLQISTPRNSFHLDEGHSHTILLAGGIGITPLLSMARRLDSLKKSFELHYCCRSETEAVFHKELQDSPFAHVVHYHYDNGDVQQLLNLEALLSTYVEGAQLYLCGPPGMMNAVVTRAEKTWPVGSLHLEYFSGDPDAGVDNVEFTVKIASSGKEYSVQGNQTVHQVLEANGIEIPVSCEQGVCGTCLVKVLEGEPEHRDSYLMDFEKSQNNQMTVCCSRSVSETLVLDL